MSFGSSMFYPISKEAYKHSLLCFQIQDIGSLQDISGWNLVPGKTEHEPLLFLAICPIAMRRWNFRCFPGCEIWPFCFDLFIIHHCQTLLQVGCVLRTGREESPPNQHTNYWKGQKQLLFSIATSSVHTSTYTETGPTLETSCSSFGAIKRK